MTTDSKALAALMAVAEAYPYAVDLTLLRQCYAIEEEHQFDESRDRAIASLRLAVEEAINNATSEEAAE